MENKPTTNAILKDGDRITVTPKHIAGEFRPVKLKSFTRYIKSIGFSYYGQSKGDHEIWINAAGDKLTINPLDGEKKHINAACTKRLGEILGCSSGDARNKVFEFDKHWVAKS